MEGLVHRKKVSKEPDEARECENSDREGLWLGEELYLLSFKQDFGYAPFWNVTLSTVLRGCVLIELGLRKRIVCKGKRRTPIRKRVLAVRSAEHTGISILDEALAYIGSRNETVSTWLEWLSGASWNPFNKKYQIQNLCERMAKDLVEKGVLSTDKVDLLIMTVTTHPLVNESARKRVIDKICHALLDRWNGEPKKFDPRLLCLILLARAAELTGAVTAQLSAEERHLAERRLQELETMDFEREAKKCGEHDIHWAVFVNLFT